MAMKKLSEMTPEEVLALAREYLLQNVMISDESKKRLTNDQIFYDASIGEIGIED